MKPDESLRQRPRPYIGISGVVGAGQQRELEALFEQSGLPPVRRLLLGVKATHKTQWLDVENKYGTDWFPVGERAFAEAAADHGAGTLRVAQVCLDERLAGDRVYRDAFTARLLDRGAEWLDGIQFDMLPWQTEVWARGYLRGLRERGLTVLVQCHGPAMSELGSVGCARRLAELADGIDYVLFDASHGTGRTMNVDALRRFLDAAAARAELSDCGLAVAGGLDSAAVTRLLPTLLAEHPHLSWDAEGCLHPARPDGSRPLDTSVAAAYIQAGAHVLS